MNMLVTTTQPGAGLAIQQGPSVLGERQARIPIGGKIRAGIKALTAAAAKHQKAMPIYNAGVAAGKSFADIEKDLVQACGFDRSPLTPRNVPYFTVRRGDFAMPEVADRIMALYAEDRGEGRHLYRFPVIFPVDAWQAVMPHSLRCFTRNELVYWSEYGPDGTRYCKTHGKIDIDPRAKRARRPYGGRPVILRPEHEGRCDPEQCAEYQARKCNLSGGLLFYVPGVPGSSAIELPTTSFYAMQQMRQQLEMVAFLRGGKFSGTVEGKPIFYLTKKQTEVSMIDPENGQAKKVKQWIVSLEADIDMTRVFQAGEARAALSAGEQAAHALEYHTEDCEFDGTDTVHVGEVVAMPDPIPPTQTAQPPANTDREQIKVLRARVADGLEMLGIAAEEFSAYATRQWGPDWGRTLNTLAAAHKELLIAGDDPESYKQKLRNADVPF